MTASKKFKTKFSFIYLDMSLFDLPILDVLPKVVADGSEGGVHLDAEVTPESYGSFIYRAFLFRDKKKSTNKKKKTVFSHSYSFFLNYMKVICD